MLGTRICRKAIGGGAHRRESAAAARVQLPRASARDFADAPPIQAAAS